MGLKFNGVDCSTVGLDIINVQRPIMAENKDVYIDIPQKPGSILIPDNTVVDIIIEVEFELEVPQGMTFMNACRAVGAYFSTVERAALVFDDDPDYSYSAKVYEGIPTIERIARYGTFTVKFRALPYEVI